MLTDNNILQTQKQTSNREPISSAPIRATRNRHNRTIKLSNSSRRFKMAPFLSPIVSGESSPVGAENSREVYQDVGSQELPKERSAKKVTQAIYHSQHYSTRKNFDLSSDEDDDIEDQSDEDAQDRNDHFGLNRRDKRLAANNSKRYAAGGADTQSNSNNLENKPNYVTVTRPTSGSVSSTASSSSSVYGSSIAQQYLIGPSGKPLSGANQLTNKQRSSSDGGCFSTANLHDSIESKRLKLKHFLQTNPLPLIGTSIIMVLIIICLLLAECKSSRAASGSHTDRVADIMHPPALPLQSGLPVEISQAPSSHRGELRRFRSIASIEGGATALRQQQHSSRPTRRHPLRSANMLTAPAPGPAAAAMSPTSIAEPLNANADDELSAASSTTNVDSQQQQQQSADSAIVSQIKRQVISKLLQQRQTSKRHQPTIDSVVGEQAQDRLMSERGGESLGVLLLNSQQQNGPVMDAGDSPSVDNLNDQSMQTNPEAIEMDGVDSGDGTAKQQAPSGFLALVDPPRPSNLRSSNQQIEVDLNGPEQAMAAGHHNGNRLHHNQIKNSEDSSPSSMLSSSKKHHHHNEANHNTNHQQQEPTSQQQHFGNNNHDRPFDVAQIQCNTTEDGFELFACPSPDFYGRYRCIEDRLFCDGYYDCPGGEDEERVSCMYYKLRQSRQSSSHRFV